MIKGLTYTILTTDDVPRARQFFTEGLGLTTEDDGEGFSQFTTRDGSLWAIMSPPPGAPGPGIMTYLLVEDADRAYAEWQARGVEMVSPPVDMPFGRTFSFRDPDGRTLHAYTRPVADQ